MLFRSSCAREKGGAEEGGSAAAGTPALPAPSTALGTGSPAAVMPDSSTPLERARSLASTIEARAASFRTDSGTWSAGDASSTFTVLLDGKQPVMLEEKLSLGERGASFSRFFYDNGRLFLYQERGIRMSTNHDRGYPMTVEKRLEIESAFDSSGAVVGSRYAEDGREEAVPEAKVEQALARGGELTARVALSGPTSR